MRLLPFKSSTEIGKAAANWVGERIIDYNPTAENQFVLGLPTGSSPLGMYNELIKLNKRGVVSFKHVVTFNMDEYVGLSRDHPASYWAFMHHNFFDHIDIPAENINILDGTSENHEEECYRYEQKIMSYGRIHLFVGGVGHDGHIAFNEPGSSLASRTRVKTLVEDTCIANARFFDNDVTKVPTMALTVGIATILDAKELLVLASGNSKAVAVQAGVEGAVNHLWTVSCLQLHRHTSMLCDQPATMELKVKTLKYFKSLERQNINRLLNMFPSE
eukprot:Lankesteria_metandrocarpae@DN3855_c0_g1_i1.p2